MSLVTSSKEIRVEYPVEFAGRGENEDHSLDPSFADTYYQAGQRNLPAIGRVVVGQYQLGPAFNRQLYWS